MFVEEVLGASNSKKLKLDTISLKKAMISPWQMFRMHSDGFRALDEYSSRLFTLLRLLHYEAKANCRRKKKGNLKSYQLSRNIAISIRQWSCYKKNTTIKFPVE